MADILDMIERFLEAHDMNPSAFGRQVMGDPNFVFDLRTGRDLRRSTEKKIRTYIEENSEAEISDGSAAA